MANKNCKEIFCANEKEGKNDICSSCRLKKWRKDNPDKVKAYANKRYLRDREKILESSKEYEKNNREIINARMRGYNKNNKELRNLREKTRYEFNDLKKNGECKNCGSKKKLEFHHLKPYKYDRFELLCRECHLEKHDRLLVRTNKKCAFVSGDENAN